jgi:hypothetical protein
MNAELIAHACMIAEELGASVLPVRVSPDPEHPDKTMKRPLITGWQNGGAVNHPEAIEALFNAHPEATHIGLLTGERSRILAIDLDGEPGLEWWRANEALLPSTRTQRTQRPGGKHLLYRMPAGCGLRNSAGKIAPGVDVRADGGFIVDWSMDFPPEIEDITDAPAALIEFLQRATSRLAPPLAANKSPDQLADQLAEGSRNAGLTRVAGKLRRIGFEIDDIDAALQVYNQRHCTKPLDPAEVSRIAASIARYEAPPEDPSSEWEPPPVVTYGPNFDPVAIPLRQWLILGRYALGEGTAIAGPPGTNKSSLLLMDAVQLVTGRSLLGDRIDQTGGVLFLVGEDRQRDFEARLAGICTHYHIAPSELGDRLHVVYQTEIKNPAGYSLGGMVEDVAMLNLQMLQWLHEYPDLVALFIDPMLSWHRLIENDNAAMLMLCLALRGLAAQANIAVAFDHHVTKVAMSDPEAHVGNLGAMRGASAIGADMRWALTMARLKAETAAMYGIADEDRRVYRRLDTLKASYGPDDDGPRILKIESVRIANGESVGVLTTVDAERLRADGQERQEQKEKDRRRQLGDALARMLREKRPRSTAEAALWLKTHAPELFPYKKGTLSDRTIRDKLPSEIGQGIDTMSNGKPARIIVPGSGIGHGTRYEIDFEQQDLP